ncbi:MAG: 1-(5-phosphoribosyl)-5-[(5-phosphoribosylamino)methylideneamino]imidazole-4-carboxamide isomerase [Oscillospiraceae bacterium]
MNIFPAIDLCGGKAVRLYKGDYAQMTVYHDDPLAVAREFEACGASFVHMVDLEGAKSGGMPNFETVRRVAQQTGLFVEVGGGVRDMQSVERYLRCGVSRVILGTAAVYDEAFLCRALATYGEKIAVGVDIADGRVATHGWTQTSQYTCEAFFEKMQQFGVKTIICTDISRDGAMRGTNRALYGALSARYCVDIIASGGVSSLDDIRALRALGLYGAIIGKAYYTGAVDLKEAIEVAK